ncbi:MAG: phosphoribosylaminoimidazolesuccinocarboxamide synthase [Myxococcota bacterium]
MSLPPLFHRGSVKNILGETDAKQLIFAYSNRYSVFDWGEMPDHIPHKGECLSVMAYVFFKALGEPKTWQNWSHPQVSEDSPTLQELRTQGLAHHMAKGLINEDGSAADIDKPTPYLEVNRVAVLRPDYNNGQYDYTAYQSKPVNALVPLEVIFRFGVPAGSSLMKRVNDPSYLNALGLSQKPNFGDRFETPIIECSTKLESTDVYISAERAAEIACLSDAEAQNLYELVRILALRIHEIFGTAGLELWDGKFEFAFAEGSNGQRRFQLVDSIGPDELRLTYDGVQLSKETLRKPYRSTPWLSAIDQAKALAKERGERDWKAICRGELSSSPAPLEPEFLEIIVQMYKALTNSVSEQLMGAKAFSDAWSIAKVAERAQG